MEESVLEEDFGMEFKTFFYKRSFKLEKEALNIFRILGMGGLAIRDRILKKYLFLTGIWYDWGGDILLLASTELYKKGGGAFPPGWPFKRVFKNWHLGIYIPGRFFSS